MSSIPLMTQDEPSVAQNASPAQWGLYLNGEPVIVANSVATFGFKATSTISTYPVEQGAFQSYDKVQLPNEGRLRFTTGGSVADRTALIDSVEAAKQALTLYDMVSPEITLLNMNVYDYEYDRKADNAGLLIVDVMVEEVRQTGNAQFVSTPGQTPIQNAASPPANDPTNTGTVQPNQPSNTQEQAVDAYIGAGMIGF